MSQPNFRASKFTLKLKFTTFFVVVVVLMAVTGILFYNSTLVAMQKDLSRSSLSVADYLAHNPNLKLGLVNEDKNLINGTIDTVATQRSVLYIVVRNTDNSFELVHQNDLSDHFFDYYKHNLAETNSPLNVVAIKTIDSGKRFFSIRVPVIRGPRQASSSDAFLISPGQTSSEDQNEKNDAARVTETGQQDMLGYIDIGISYDSIDQSMHRVVRWSASLLSLIVIIVFVFLLVIFRFVIRPIEVIAQRATLIAEGDLSQMVTVRAKDEIGQLAFNFNLMAERLSENKTARDEAARQLSVVNDQLEQANRQLQHQFEQVLAGKREWETTFNAMADAVFIFDENHMLRQVNTAGKVLGDRWSYLIGKETCCLLLSNGISGCLAETNDDCASCPLDQVFRYGKQLNFERSDSSTNEFFLTALYPIPYRSDASGGAIAVVRDITEEKTLRVQLLQSEKMSAIGQLVSGVAHELNNPLNAVIGYSELCMEHPLFKDELMPFISCVVNEGLRARKIVQNLLTVSRQHKPEKKNINVNDVLRLTLDLRSYEMRVSNIDIIEEFDSNLPLTMCDPHQLQQVFLNIIVNAEQAMLSAHGNGRLTIQTLATKDNSIQVRIADDGPGIAPDKMARIFDPFFTTKEVGEGTGLGLSISYGIVKEHGGHIWVQSQEGSGSTFVVELPLISEPSPHNGQKSESLTEVTV